MEQNQFKSAKVWHYISDLFFPTQDHKTHFSKVFKTLISGLPTHEDSYLGNTFKNFVSRWKCCSICHISVGSAYLKEKAVKKLTICIHCKITHFKSKLDLGNMFASIQSLLLHTEAVRKREESSFSHLYANPEASGACLGSISGCKEKSTLTRLLRFTWLLSSPLLCSSGSLLKGKPHDWKEQKKLLESLKINTSTFQLLSPIQSETPWMRGVQKAQGHLILHLKCITWVIRQYRAQAVKDAPFD